MTNRIGQYATLNLLMDYSYENRFVTGEWDLKNQTYPYKVISQCGPYVFLKHVERGTCTVAKFINDDRYFNPFYVKDYPRPNDYLYT